MNKTFDLFYYIVIFCSGLVTAFTSAALIFIALDVGAASVMVLLVQIMVQVAVILSPTMRLSDSPNNSMALVPFTSHHCHTQAQ